MTVPAQVDALVAAAVQATGRLDVMVCNAGLGYNGRLDETYTTETLADHMSGIERLGELVARHRVRRRGVGGCWTTCWWGRG